MAFHEPQRLLRRVCCHDPPLAGKRVERGGESRSYIGFSTTSGRAPRFDACVVNKPDKPHEHASSMLAERERKRERKNGGKVVREVVSKRTFCDRLLSLFPFFVSLPLRQSTRRIFPPAGEPLPRIFIYVQYGT